jgi:hypothetical protein
LPADLLAIVNQSFDAAALKERADLLEIDRSLQSELTETSPVPASSRLRSSRQASTCKWRTTYGSKAWEKLEQYTGKLT